VGARKRNGVTCFLGSAQPRMRAFSFLGGGGGGRGFYCACWRFTVCSTVPLVGGW